MTEDTNHIPVVYTPPPDELHRLCKIVDALLGKLSLNSWHYEFLTKGEAESQDYRWDELFRDVLVCEAHLEPAAKAVRALKEQLVRRMGSNMLGDL